MKPTISRSLLVAIVTTLLLQTTLANAGSAKIVYSVYGGSQRALIKPTPSSFTLIGNQLEVLYPTYRSATNFLPGLGLKYQYSPDTGTRLSNYANALSLGVDAFYTRMTRYGMTYDYGIFNNYNYRMRVESLRLMVNGEWTLPGIFSHLYPFFIVGVGPAYNSASYSDQANPSAPLGVSINMPKESSIAFAYNIGAGVKLPLTRNIEISIRYLYSDLGVASTGSEANLTLAHSIQIPIITQTWLLGISYSVDIQKA